MFHATAGESQSGLLYGAIGGVYRPGYYFFPSLIGATYRLVGDSTLTSFSELAKVVIEREFGLLGQGTVLASGGCVHGHQQGDSERGSTDVNVFSGAGHHRYRALAVCRESRDNAGR
jgi:hypothetical protein